MQWVTKGSEAEFYEEPGCSSSTPYAHSFTSSVTINGSSVYVSYEGDSFTAIRYDSITQDQPPTGNLDSASCDAITGTASDPDSPTTPLEIDLTFDAPTGQMGSGTLTTQVANKLLVRHAARSRGRHAAHGPRVRERRADAGASRAALVAEDVHVLASRNPTGHQAPRADPCGHDRVEIRPAELDVAKEPLAAMTSVPSGPDFPASSPTAVISDDGSPDVWVIDTAQDGSTVRRHRDRPGVDETAWSYSTAATWTKPRR